MSDAATLRSGREIAAVLFAALAPPVAWMLGLNADYALVRLACTKDDPLPLHLVTLLSLALCLSGGWVAYSRWRRVGGGSPDEGPGAASRTRFLAVLGMLACALFTLVILGQWAAKLFLHPCMGI